MTTNIARLAEVLLGGRLVGGGVAGRAWRGLFLVDIARALSVAKMASAFIAGEHIPHFT